MSLLAPFRHQEPPVVQKSSCVQDIINEKATEFPQLKENTIRVYKHRAHYDYNTVYNILANTFFSTVSFVVPDEDGEPSPFSLPMTAVAGQYDPSSPPLPRDDGSEESYVRQQESCNDEPFDVYLHGNTAMMLRKMTSSASGSLKVVISSTKVDGVVLHFAPNGHSLNYRSCVIHGTASLVTSTDEKYYAMQRLTNHMSRRRWSATNPVAAEAMKKIQVVKVSIRSASAKVRAAGLAGLEKAGLGEREDVWTGVIPVWENMGEPIESEFVGERKLQPQIEDWISRRNRDERAYAEKAGRL